MAQKPTEKPWCFITVHSDEPGTKVKIDQEDMKRVSQHSWRVTKGTTGRMRVVTSVRTEKGVRHLTLGKFLMKPPKGKMVYPRRFNDGLDYRKDNLVVCTLRERQRLLPKNRKKKSSNYRGVSFSSADQKWKAGIEVNGKAINLGHFETEDEAAYAYNDAARKHFGDIAYQNRIGVKLNKRRD